MTRHLGEAAEARGIEFAKSLATCVVRVERQIATLTWCDERAELRAVEVGGECFGLRIQEVE